MFEEKPLISIIVPMYNAEQYLERCVNSILKQTYTNLEIILVDDGSPDSSGILADSFAKKDGRIKVIHQENRSQGSARNVGILRASGKYISFIDSDDWVTSDMIEYLYSLISRYKTDYAAIDCISTDNTISVIKQPFEEVKVLSQKKLFDLFFRISSTDINYCVWDKLYKAELVKRIQFAEGKRFEDIDYCYHIIKQCSSAAISNRICYFYFKNPEGITNGLLKPSDYDLFDIWQRIVDDCKLNLPEYEYHAQYNYARAYLGLIGKAAKCGVSDSFLNWKTKKNELLLELRKQKEFLLSGNLSISRKLVLILCCIHPLLLELAYKLLYKFKRLETKC